MGPLVILSLLTVSPEHMRLFTSRGPVHVLVHPHAQLTVIYVHGYWTRLDEAWVQQGLAQQLLASGLSATFIAPEAPAGPDEEVVWPDLDALLAEVEAQTGATLPLRVVAVGHSGAYRTLAPWTASARAKGFILLDAFYAGPGVWEQWLDAHADARLVVLARATKEKSAPFCRRREGPQVRCELSSESHMAIITHRRALPRLLAALEV